MREDEAAAIRPITACRETMTAIRQQFRGGPVETPGDNLPAVFSKAGDAVLKARRPQV